MLGLGTSLVKGGKVGRTYVKDGLKLYMPYRGSDASEVDFVGTGSTSFDGDDYIKIDSAIGDFEQVSTFCAWVYRDGLASAYDYIVDFRGDSAGGKGYVTGSTGAATIDTSGSGGGTRYINGVQGATATPIGAWFHFAITGMDIDIDEDMKIGIHNNGSSHGMLGSLKNIALWNRVLTATEIQNVMYKSYNEVSGRLASGLVSWWALDADSLGSETVTNGDVETGDMTGWGAVNSGTSVVQTANPTSPIAGTYDSKTVITGNDGSHPRIHVTISALTSGKTYRVSYKAKASKTTTPNYVSLRVGLAGTELALTRNELTTSTQTFTQTVVATGAHTRFIWYAASLDGETVYIDDVSVKEVEVEDLKGSNDGSIYGVTIDEDLYGGDTPVIPRGIDNAPTVQADAIGAGSALFDDTDDYIDLGTDNSLNIIQNFTVLFWAKSTVATNDALIYGREKGESDDAFAQLQIRQNTAASGRLTVQTYNTGGWQTVTVNSFFPDGEWVHGAVAIGATASTQAVTVYKNGVQAGTGTLDSNGIVSETDKKVTIGGIDLNGLTNFFGGNICQVGIWDAVLTQTQIQSIMEKTFEELIASEKTNLVSYWALDEAVLSDTVVVDKVNPSYSLGSDLVTNGGLGTDSDWSKETGWTIAGGHAVVTNGAINNALHQAIDTVAGELYKLTFTCDTFGDGSLGAYTTATAVRGNILTGTGTSTLVFEATGSSHRIGAITLTANSDYTIDDITCYQITSSGNLGVLR